MTLNYMMMMMNWIQTALLKPVFTIYTSMADWETGDF